MTPRPPRPLPRPRLDLKNAKTFMRSTGYRIRLDCLDLFRKPHACARARANRFCICVLQIFLGLGSLGSLGEASVYKGQSRLDLDFPGLGSLGAAWGAA